MMRALSPTALAVVLSLGTGCSNHDPRIPKQPTPPTVPNAPQVDRDAAPNLAQADAAPTPDATPTPDAAPTPDGATAPDAAGTAGADLGDGIAEAKALVEDPKWDDAAALTKACDRALARAEAGRKRFHDGVAAEEALKAFDQLTLEVDAIDGYASLMFNVSPVKEVRDAAETCRTALSKFDSDVSLDRAVYDAVAKVPTEGLDAIGRYFVERSVRDFKLAGVDKDDATRTRISEINDELTKLSQEYQKNVNGDTRSITIEPAALAGLPEDWQKAHVAGADGKVTVTTDYPDLMPFLTYSDDAAARKALANASAARAYPANAEVLKKVLTLRGELARLIGYPSYAALDLADKMTGTPEVVETFLAGARDAAKPKVDSDLAELLARKKKIDKAATTVEVEDRFYLQNLVKKEKYGVDAKAVREYFDYPAVRDGILALYGQLFGVAFTKREGAAVWSPDVDAYEVTRDGQVIGRFYFDMHPRPDKYKHAAMFPIATGLSDANGQTTRVPYASLVCNFPAPTKESAVALMDHSQVVTFFHEFGHLIHHLLAQQSPWISLSGINVEWDFVEAPSQLLEEWAWDPKVLATFAENAAGEVIPAALMAKMKKADEFGKGVELARQLFYAAYSYQLHKADPATLDLEAFTSQMYADWSPYPRPADDHLYANFAHLIGYKSAYYTYQWSLSIAKDLFTRFKAKGLLDAGVAADYRTKVLEPGGTNKAEALVQDFLGRERNLDAYRAWIMK